MRVCGGPWAVTVESDGSISRPVKPDLDQFQVQITKVGTSVLLTRALLLNGSNVYGAIPIKDGVAKLGDMKLSDPALSVVAPAPASPAAPPQPQPAVPLAPPAGAPKY